MNQAHLHLLINHLPIFGSILGALILIQGLYTRSFPVKIAAYNIFIVSAIGAAIAYFTGEPAEEAVENIQGIAENLIELHEDQAFFSLVALIILGSISLIGIFLSLKKHAASRMYAIVVLIVSIISFALVARTGYTGGQIRHTEINSPATEGTQNVNEESAED